ncbi:MAG TPA: TetR/AcrR family transcriptional regulator [Candidatus Limnocylindria bacterium]|jgi:AcrR family transcriptional regulator|nr:TetR/AcrR family transcriptional regulator [Candidatus Limnocylindria bacterium]
MPKLWTDTIDTHRREVHDAIVETTAALVGKHGLPAVTMARIAEETGIGRATLYKYFSDVEAILVAWHERHVQHHLRSLTDARDRAADPGERLEAVLETYATITHDRARAHRAGETHGAHAGTTAPAREHHGALSHSHERHSGEIAALVHRSEHVARVEARLIEFVSDVLKVAAKAGKVRRDVPPHELARFCLDALGAARRLPSRPAVRRLVAVTLAGLRPTKRG